jgi:hypothetical protein
MTGRMLFRAAVSARPSRPQPARPWPGGGRLLAWAVITGLCAPYWRTVLIAVTSVVLVLPLAILLGRHQQRGRR